jgi:hypothetical protein
MKESLRRGILFTVIVITGSVMIFFDVPLTILIPLILAVGFAVLVLLGAITLSDITSVFKRPKFENLRKIAVLRRLDEMKFFEKNPVQPDKKPASSKKKEESGFNDAKKTGAGSQLRSFFSSFRSLGTVLKERSRHKKKVEHINELLDKAVGEKVKGSALASAGKGVDSGTSPTGSIGGRGPQEQAKDQDPFMALSGDEFDASLLDGLDDTESAPPRPSPGQGPSPVAMGGPGLTIQEPDIPMSPLDISSEADDILKDNAGGLEEFSGLEGGESIDQDFEDLENLNLDDVDLDVDREEEAPKAAGGASLPGEIPKTSVKTDWIPSDAPKGAVIAGNQISHQADMAAFAGGASGSDEDMLSSLASEAKHVKKERNLSLLRDLKDFRAPADEIEDELKETYKRLRLPETEKKKASRMPKE